MEHTIPSCPHCGGTIEIYEINSEYYPELYEVYYHGECLNCHQRLAWTDYYEYAGYTSVKELR